MKVVDVNSNKYVDFDIENNDNDPKFEFDDYVRVSKQKIIFAKGSTPNQSEEDFAIKNFKNTVPPTYLIEGFNG